MADPRLLTTTRRYLRAGTRSVREVRTYLAQRHVLTPVVDRVVAECQARGWLDDRACAALCADHWAQQGYAWTAIRERLEAKGLATAVIDEAARAVGASPSDDAARARHLLQRSARAGGRSGAAVQGAARRLAARGFDPDTIERTLAEFFNAEP